MELFHGVQDEKEAQTKVGCAAERSNRGQIEVKKWSNRGHIGIRDKKG